MSHCQITPTFSDVDNDCENSAPGTWIFAHLFVSLLFHFCFVVFLFVLMSLTIAQVGTYYITYTFLIILPQLPKQWDNRLSTFGL